MTMGQNAEGVETNNAPESESNDECRVGFLRLEIHLSQALGCGYTSVRW